MRSRSQSLVDNQLWIRRRPALSARSDIVTAQTIRGDSVVESPSSAMTTATAPHPHHRLAESCCSVLLKPVDTADCGHVNTWTHNRPH